MPTPNQPEIPRSRAAALTAAALLIAAATLSACNTNHASVRVGQPSTAGQSAVAKAPQVAPGQIETAELREKALALLVAEARSELPERRANAIEGLIPVPSRLRPLLSDALVDPNLGVRAVAAAAVGKARLQPLAPNVRPLVHDESPMVRAAAVYALIRCADNSPEADPTPLGELLWHDNPRVRAQAAFFLGELREPSAAPMLKDSLRIPIPRVAPTEARLMHLQFAEARVKLGEEEALHEIRAALYPSRPDDLEATALAAQIIGEVRDRGSTDQLIYLTAWRDKLEGRLPWEIRLAAAGSLARLGLPQGGFLARQVAGETNPVLRAQAAHVFGQTRLPENLPALALMLQDPDGQVRLAAAAAILQITERAPGAAGPTSHAPAFTPR